MEEKKITVNTGKQNNQRRSNQKKNNQKRRKRKTGNNNSSNNNTTSLPVKKSAEEMRKWFAEYSDLVSQYQDPKKTMNVSFQTYSKDDLRSFMENPYANYKNLRSISRFLYNRSRVYKRLVVYFANMIDLKMRSVIPKFNFLDQTDEQSVLQKYYETLTQLEVMNLPLEFLKAYMTCFREDVFFGAAYCDQDGFFILPIDSERCRVTGLYKDGSLAFHMDMSYFSSNKDLLEFWGEPFQSMYEAYEKDQQNGKWQPMPDANAVCLKYNIDDLTTPLPPFMGIFDSLINLEDLKEITAISDEQRIYKLLAMSIPLLSASREVNDFAVDLDTMAKFYNRITDVIPDYANIVLTPSKIDTVSFEHDQTTDVNKVENATKNIMKVAGGQALVGDSGSTAINMAISTDENEAISSLLPQTEAIVNRLLSFVIKDPAKVVFHEVTTFSKDKYRENLIRSATYGVPVKTDLAIASGFSELDIIRKGYLEKMLNIQDLYTPLQSSNTMNTTGLGDKKNGRPSMSDDDISEDGEASRDKRERSG